MTNLLPIVAAIITAPARRAVERHHSARETENGKTVSFPVKLTVEKETGRLMKASIGGSYRAASTASSSGSSTMPS